MSYKELAAKTSSKKVVAASVDFVYVLDRTTFELDPDTALFYKSIPVSPGVPHTVRTYDAGTKTFTVLNRVNSKGSVVSGLSLIHI